MLILLPIVLSFVVGASAWAFNRGRTVVQTDRVGAAGFVVGFVAGHHALVGPGWDSTRPITWLPLIAVVGALIGPRLATRVGEVQVGVAARALVLVAPAALCAFSFGLGNALAGQLELAVFGAAIGVLASGLLTGPRDARVATWVLIAALAGLVPALAPS